MANIFKQVSFKKPQKSAFDLTHDVKLSGKMGHLMPTLVLECVPGDSISIGGDALIRFAPLLAPAMHRYDVYIHYFFVPNRILWDGFQDWITNKEGAEAYPQVEVTNLATTDQRRFLDYMGVPPTISGGGIQTENTLISALPFAAYQAIYNEYYRDQNLINEVDYKVTGGTQTAAKRNILWTMRNRAWEHDYFTSALPFAQKGDAVDIPIGKLDVNEEVKLASDDMSSVYGRMNAEDTTSLIQHDAFARVTATSGENPEGKLYIDFEKEIEPTTINDLRRAFRLQEWFEKMARGGSRYIEQIYSHFGVKSPDARLQRPEYITGVKSPIVISEVLNTTGEDGGLPQGNMSGHGAGVTTGKFGKYDVYEHGFIIGIMSVRPKTAYMDGIPKHYLKSDPLDIYWPTFAHIGEQEVQQQELFAYTANKTATFGYVPRYAEYKYMPSRVAGEFRTSLNYWHGARKFANNPALNQTFIECTPDQTNRIFAVQENADHLYCHVLHKIKAYRPMPIFGTPMI